MDLQFNIEKLKTPRSWAVIVPVVLFLWLLVALILFYSACNDAQSLQNKALQTRQDVTRILAIRKQFGKDDPARLAALSFNGLESAIDATRKAGIPPQRVSQAASPRPLRQKDGSLLFQETYKLIGVKLLNLATFIDDLERAFPALNCTQLSLTREPSEEKDHWNATLDLKYLKK